jgi:hypothetical protein
MNYVAVQHSSTLFMNKWSGTSILTAGLTPVIDRCARGIPGPLPNLIIAARAVGRGGHVAAFPPGTPVLWIDSPGDTPTGTAGPSIPRRFSPRELRQRVAELLIAPGARAASPPAPSTRLQPPYVTSDAARAIGQALDTELPLHLVGESGTGKRFVARAIHAARGNGPFLPSPGAHFDTALLTIPAAQGGTLFIDRADQLGGAAQQALLANIDPTGRIRLADGATLTHDSASLPLTRIRSSEAGFLRLQPLHAQRATPRSDLLPRPQKRTVPAK